MLANPGARPPRLDRDWGRPCERNNSGPEIQSPTNAPIFPWPLNHPFYRSCRVFLYCLDSRRVRGCLLYMPDVRLFRGQEISVDSSPELSVRRFETLVPATNEPMEGFVGTTANRQQNFDFSKQISQTILQTAGVSVDALTSHFQFCGEGDSSGSWSAGSTDRRIVVFPPLKGQEQHSLTLNDYGLGVEFHSGIFRICSL